MAEIKPLACKVARSIEASSSITSLNIAVLGLLENALDASSTTISIKVDYGRGRCYVDDDGTGIYGADFEQDGGLGKAHHTSNVSGSKDRLGSHGLFLSSLAALSTLTIISRHQSSTEANALILQHSKLVSRLIPAPDPMTLDLAEHGTRVLVHDLFGNMAVRVKQRPASQEDRSIRDKHWNSLCLSIAGIVLGWGRPISVAVKGTDESHRFRINTLKERMKHVDAHRHSRFAPGLITSTLRQAFDLESKSECVQTSARTSQITTRALIYLVPSASRRMQFISVHNKYVPPGELFEPLYEMVNRVFWNSSFGLSDEATQDNFPAGNDGGLPTVIQNREIRRCVERWPMFFIKIEPKTHEVETSRYQAHLITIQETLKAMLVEFLQEHMLQPTTSRNYRVIPRPNSHFNTLPPETTPTASKLRVAAIRTKKDHECEPAATEKFSRQDFAVDYPSDEADFSIPVLVNDSRFRSRLVSSNISGPRSALNVPGVPLTVAPEEVITAIPETPLQHVVLKKPGEGGMSILQKHSESLELPTARSKTALAALDGDEFMEWTDPHTQQNYHVNTRTGWMREVKHATEPVASDGTDIQVAIDRKQSHRIPKLVRSTNGLAPAEQGSWMQQVLSTWKNPVFETTERPLPIHQVDYFDCGEQLPPMHGCHSGSALTTEIAALPGIKMSAAALKRADVIGQVDAKFILMTLPDINNCRSETVVLVDQHASDERIKVEKLLHELCSPPSSHVQQYTSPLDQKSGIDTVILEDPILFDLSYREHDVFVESATYLARWGILFDIKQFMSKDSVPDTRSSCRLAVLSLPACIAQRCKVETGTLIRMLRTEVWDFKEGRSVLNSLPSTEVVDWTKSIQWCPQGILNLINSRACRSAIMFNDVLNLTQCQQLISALAECQFPFQCAHGRPSMVPLMVIDRNEINPTIGDDEEGGESFQKGWTRWLENTQK